MPIIMLWLGIGDASKTLVIFLGRQPAADLSQLSGRARRRGEDAVVGGGHGHVAARSGSLRIVLPAALPEIFVGCRTGLVLALITMVTSEMIARQSGVGNILFNSLDMAQYDTVYAMIVIIGVLGFVLDVVFEQLRASAGRLGRAGAPDRGRDDMTARAGHPSSLIGAAADRAAARRCGTGSPPPGWRRRRCCRRRCRCSRVSPSSSAIRPFLQHAATTLFRLFAGFAIAVVIGVGLGVAADRQPHDRGAGQAAGARAGAGAEDRALSGLHPDPRLRACLQDRAGCGRRACSRSCSPPTRARRAVEPKLVWSARAAGTSRAASAVHGRAAGGVAFGADRLPHRPRHLLHRRVPGRDDHLDRWPRAICWSTPRATSRPSTCSCR